MVRVVVRVRWWQQLCGGDVREIGASDGALHKGGPCILFFFNIIKDIFKFQVQNRWQNMFDYNYDYIMMAEYVSYILLLEWSTTSQRLWVYRISVSYAQKDPRFLFEKRRGQPREFWSLVSIIYGSTLPQDCVEEQPC